MATVFKSSSTCLKYLYQIALNYKRKSCAGLSAPGITLDWIGAICCLTQIQLESKINGYGFFLVYPDLNIAKFLLAFITLTCEGVILYQIWYYSQKEVGDIELKLLPTMPVDLNQCDSTMDTSIGKRSFFDLEDPDRKTGDFYLFTD